MKIQAELTVIKGIGTFIPKKPGSIISVVGKSSMEIMEPF
ncbi:hypothetical protein X839_07630 [Streptococcus thermophilus MTH17CL396]|nr:hypothetical protein X839_07630 [Streptococcus thermophilus MTH17CL396]